MHSPREIQRKVALSFTEQHLIVRSSKSDTAITNNNRLQSSTVLLKLTADRHEALRGLSAVRQQSYLYMSRSVISSVSSRFLFFRSLID